ncbi:MAG: hypothetical protein MUF49_14695 [Oculatellaceae cyanobacterium Prado106]|nr:hypothetical protein [Oculatellaceae cyanobacterium Prado106]
MTSPGWAVERRMARWGGTWPKAAIATVIVGDRQIPHQTIASDQLERFDGRYADLRSDVDRTVLRWPY